jgi:hypothetical protein
MLTQKMNQTRLEKRASAHLLDAPAVHNLIDLACAALALPVFTVPQLTEPVV